MTQVGIKELDEHNCMNLVSYWSVINVSHTTKKLTVWTCSSFVQSAENLKRTSEPFEQDRGERIKSLAVPTTTYHSVGLRDANVQTARLVE